MADIPVEDPPPGEQRKTGAGFLQPRLPKPRLTAGFVAFGSRLAVASGLVAVSALSTFAIGLGGPGILGGFLVVLRTLFQVRLIQFTHGKHLKLFFQR